MRGSLFPPVESDLCPAAQEAYELFVRVQRLDNADLYGGKLCAALDRQQPRDLFDIMHPQAAGEIPDERRPSGHPYQSRVPAPHSSGRMMAHHPSVHDRYPNRRTREAAEHANIVSLSRIDIR